MFGSKILEVALGIVFLYILISILCSAIRESIEALLKTRAAHLEQGIRELLNDPKAEGLADSFFNHPLIYCLFSGEYKPDKSARRPGMFASGGNLPSYVPAKNFALALMDMAARGPNTESVGDLQSAPVVSLDAIRSNVSKLQNPKVQRAVLAAIDSAQGDLNRAQANIESWFDGAMDRISGQYKRSTHWIIFWVGLTVAVTLNVNTITVADYLYRNDAVRAAMVAKAAEAAKDQSVINKNYENAKNDLDSMRLPIGWSAGWDGSSDRSHRWSNDWFKAWLAQLLGWVLTAFAAALGAPFWFDVLNKLMVIRSTVKPHEKSPRGRPKIVNFRRRQQVGQQTPDKSRMGRPLSDDRAELARELDAGDPVLSVSRGDPAGETR
jgi:hypothetical protein